ncbi:ABC transporter substrate-binding protein [Thalassotalea ganghwensis]
MQQNIVVAIYALMMLMVSAPIAALEKPPIVLASSNALTGPAASLGKKLNLGAQLYFDKINQQGGIFGRKIELRSLDDGYEPYKTFSNTQKFIEDRDVFALFNFVGTPTSSAIMPLLQKHQIPYITPFTGADFLRTPVSQNIINLRASYQQEAASQIDYLINTVKRKKIALMVQADEFGLAVEEGYLKELQRYGLKPVVTTRYRRNTEDIELSLDIMQNYDIDAVAFVGTYRPLAHFINLAAQQNFNPFYVSVSFISSKDLFKWIKVPASVLVTEVFPEPSSCQLAACKQFIVDAKQAAIDSIDQVTFEGYLNAILFTEVAKRCKDKLSQTCFIAELNQFKGNLLGFEVAFSEDDHQGHEKIYHTLSNTQSKRGS